MQGYPAAGLPVTEDLGALALGLEVADGLCDVRLACAN